MKKATYKESGVNIDEGNALVDGIKPIAKSTFDSNVIGGIGSFAGAYALPRGYKEPILFGATDGVGTKLRLAIDSGKLDSIGIDLVAMCVNDLICNFATPLFFLDYYATGKLNKKSALQVISGIAMGCKMAQCALIGGESAEMPSMYQGKDFDLAGFAVGVAEKGELQNNPKVASGDVIIALASSGLHSNGYSLARKVIFENLKMHFDTPFEGRTIGEILLEPTKIYVPIFHSLRPKIKALAHITGGGIVENLPRVLDSGLCAKINKTALLKLTQKLPIFALLQSQVDEQEALRVFNMGVGMVLVTDRKHANEVITKSGGYEIGEVMQKSGKTRVKFR